MTIDTFGYVVGYTFLGIITILLIWGAIND